MYLNLWSTLWVWQHCMYSQAVHYRILSLISGLIWKLQEVQWSSMFVFLLMSYLIMSFCEIWWIIKLKTGSDSPHVCVCLHVFKLSLYLTVLLQCVATQSEWFIWSVCSLPLGLIKISDCICSCIYPDIMQTLPGVWQWAVIFTGASIRPVLMS